MGGCGNIAWNESRGCSTRKEAVEDGDHRPAYDGKMIGPQRLSFIMGESNDLEGLGLYDIELTKV